MVQPVCVNMLLRVNLQPFKVVVLFVPIYKVWWFDVRTLPLQLNQDLYIFTEDVTSQIFIPC